MPEPGPIPPLLLLGCGRMGMALLRGWQTQGLAPSFAIDPGAIDPGALDLGALDLGAMSVEPPHRLVADAKALPAGFRPHAIVLAVKPQMAGAALPGVSHLADGALVLSIMAGRTLAGLAPCFAPGTAIVRAMPNTPAAIGQGVTVACAGPHVRAGGRALADRLLDAAGETAWVEDEAMLDPVTAISGSGPAYVFLLAELLEQAGREQGLPPDLARLLARRTVSGAGALLELAQNEEADALRRAVTSPGGTTEQALSVLMAEAAWPRSVRAAIEAATQRSRVLAR